jgi:hypothetical protein
MIRHDHYRMKMDCPAMIMQAMLQNQATNRRRKFQMLRRTKGYEQGSIIALVMRKATAIFVTAESCGEHGNRSHQIVWAGNPPTVRISK